MNHKDTRPLLALWMIVMILIRSQISAALPITTATDAPVPNTALVSVVLAHQ